jgi:hypothetical protein
LFQLTNGFSNGGQIINTKFASSTSAKTVGAKLMRHYFFILTVFILLSSCTNKESKSKSNNTTTIYQTWVLDSASIFPVIIPSFCDSLCKGALFTFTKDNRFFVHSAHDTCGAYQYTYDSLTKTIQVLEIDMIFNFDSVVVFNNKLEMKNDFTEFPNHSGPQHLFILEHGNHLYLKSYNGN